MSLPWKTVHNQVRTVNGNHVVAVMWETGQQDSAAIMEHDCAFIVRACNEHAELVQKVELLSAAVRAASDSLRSYQYGNSSPQLAEECADALDAAIAKV